MSAEPTSPQTPSKTSPWWKWLRRIGCAATVLAFTCCAGTCSGTWWLRENVRNLNKDEVDRLHVEGLRLGDVRALYERADERFRKQVTLEELEAFVRERPGLLERDQLHGGGFVRHQDAEGPLVKIRSQRGLVFIDEWDIIFRIVDGVYRLVGISPGLDSSVPDDFRFRKTGPGRRHRWHH